MRKKLLSVLLATVMVLSTFFAVNATMYGFTMSYKEGTEDTVTNMPSDDEVLANPYTVSDTVPQREGYIFLGWKLDYETAETFTVTVRFVEQGKDDDLIERKEVLEVPLGTTLSFEAESIENFDLSDESKKEITVSDDPSKNVLKFEYKRALTDCTVYFLEEGTEKELATPVALKDKGVGLSFDYTAPSIENYELVSEETQSLTPVRNAEENILKFYYRKMKRQYEVHYLDSNTKKDIADCMTGEPSPVGSTVKADYIEIENYDLDDVESKELVISKNEEENVINFYYLHILPYTVNYLETGTDKVLKMPKTGRTTPVGTTVWEDAEEIDGYKLDSDERQYLTISEGENVINFYYSQKTAVYKVEYLDNETKEPVADEKTGEPSPVGHTVIEGAVSVDYYDLISDSPMEITIDEDPDKNVITFLYERKKADVTVRYLDVNTDVPLADDNIYTDQKVGTDYSVYAKTINGYELIGSTSKTVTVNEDSEKNIVIFYYDLPKVAYTVNYLEYGSDAPIADPTTGEGKATTSVFLDAAQIDDYELCDFEDNRKQLDLSYDESENVIDFYYYRTKAPYTVRYLDVNTGKSVAADKTGPSTLIGGTATENAITVKKYDLADESSKTIEIKADPDENVITFYYSRLYTISYNLGQKSEKPSGTSLPGSDKVAANSSYSVSPLPEYQQPAGNYVDYEVNYYDVATYERIKEPKYDGDIAGTSVTEKAVDIEGYVLASSDVNSKTITLNDPNKPYYVFDGWYLDKKCTGERVDYIDSVNEDIKLYGKWIKATAPENKIDFFYERASFDYTVHYISVLTGEELIPAKPVFDIEYGTPMIEIAEAIDGYEIFGPDLYEFTVTEDDMHFYFFYNYQRIF